VWRVEVVVVEEEEQRVTRLLLQLQQRHEKVFFSLCLCSHVRVRAHDVWGGWVGVGGWGGGGWVRGAALADLHCLVYSSF
jgi:hypothetical protein